MIFEFGPCCLNALGLDQLTRRLPAIIVAKCLADAPNFLSFLASGFYVERNPCSNRLRFIQYPSSGA